MPARLIAAALVLSATLAGCASPEATRVSGSGSGGDVGNRTEVVDMHEGSQPYWRTPRAPDITPPPPGPARQANRLSRP